MSLENDLTAIEKRLWTGGAEAYRSHLDEECLIAFTEMAGVMSRDAIAETVSEGNRWQSVEMDPRGLLQPNADLAILTYGAKARRADGEPYEALVSSGYTRRGSEWKMVFHQQTPIGG